MSLLANKNARRRPSLCGFAKFLCTVLFFPVLSGTALAQEAMPQQQAASATPLAALLDEAEKSNPQIAIVRLGWEAAKLVPTQVSTLPDPQFTLQHLSVGSPRPFAGYTNSDFAYIGLGFSQDTREVGKFQAQLKELLNRTQDSVDIEPDPLSETAITHSYGGASFCRQDAESGARRFTKDDR